MREFWNAPRSSCELSLEIRDVFVSLCISSQGLLDARCCLDDSFSLPFRDSCASLDDLLSAETKTFLWNVAARVKVCGVACRVCVCTIAARHFDYHSILSLSHMYTWQRVPQATNMGIEGVGGVPLSVILPVLGRDRFGVH